MSSAKRGNRVTREQLLTMLDYFAANPGLAEGKTRSMMSKQDILKKWEEMAALLHAADGPEKTVDQWQVVWRDLKSRTNIKVKECRQRMSRGEDISANSTFTDLELRVVDILGTEDMENLKEPKTDYVKRREKRTRIFNKFEHTDDDSYDDPLTMQNIAEEEYVEDEDYNEIYNAPISSKKLKPANYAAVANALHSSSRNLNDSESSRFIQPKSSYTSDVSHHHIQEDANEITHEIGQEITHEIGQDVTQIEANAMMMQAEAAKISAEAAKMNAEAAKMYASAAKSNAEALNKIAEAIRFAAEVFAKRYD